MELAYDFGKVKVYKQPIKIAYYDDLGIPKDADGRDVTRSFKFVMITDEDGTRV